MTYYAKLIRKAAAAMNQHPRSTVTMDAETLKVLSVSKSATKVAKSAQEAVARGRTPVILGKPCHEATWIR